MINDYVVQCMHEYGLAEVKIVVVVTPDMAYLN